MTHQSRWDTARPGPRSCPAPAVASCAVCALTSTSTLRATGSGDAPHRQSEATGRNKHGSAQETFGDSEGPGRSRGPRGVVVKRFAMGFEGDVGRAPEKLTERRRSDIGRRRRACAGHPGDSLGRRRDGAEGLRGRGASCCSWRDTPGGR
ncbi:hypothetical protein SCA03_16230 [Streptomyces cacaoi]|uniref:Uncharacterized protein n=1 Tax=Streptomyces cacaoi TaxID=1898 RepID=A0A4Y3QV34_STRCI|nr:hypothetical protein SCA03_16230 [Streptomyces cacaoi]